MSHIRDNDISKIMLFKKSSWKQKPLNYTCDGINRCILIYILKFSYYKSNGCCAFVCSIYTDDNIIYLTADVHLFISEIEL